MSISPLEPDPSVIGGINKAPFALLPDPARLFKERAARFERLAADSRIAPYLAFLQRLSLIQAALAAQWPPAEPVAADRVERARENAMPTIDRAADREGCRIAVKAFIDAAVDLTMPAPALGAFEEVRAADAETLDWLIDNVLAGQLPADSLAHHLFVAAALQLHFVRRAGGLDAKRLVPVSTGVCPACGGRPLASIVVGIHGAEGARYACCATCATRWNEVRVKCLACGSTKGVGYRAVEEGGEGERDAVIKAEVCDACSRWVKILYQNKNPSLEPVADDVASLGLDLLMKDTEYARWGFNPFLAGY